MGDHDERAPAARRRCRAAARAPRGRPSGPARRSARPRTAAPARRPARGRSPPAAAGRPRAAPGGGRRGPRARPRPAPPRTCWRLSCGPASRDGSATFCAAVSAPSRLKDWKTKPSRSRRSRASALSPSAETSVSPRCTRPEVGRSSPAADCSSVDLPDPEGPMTAVNVPGSKPSVTPSSARTVPSPEPKSRIRVSSWRAVMPFKVPARALLSLGCSGDLQFGIAPPTSGKPPEPKGTVPLCCADGSHRPRRRRLRRVSQDGADAAAGARL